MYDVSYRHALKMCNRYRHGNITAYKNLSEFLKSDIEAVLVLIPHAFHQEVVRKCAEAGKHVLCEKPMAVTLEECDSMIEATREAGVKFMIAENHRFLPAHRYIHDVIKEGLIGDVLLVRAYGGVNEIAGITQPGSWKGDIMKAGGGCFMDMAAHKFATLEWILEDRVHSVTAMLSKQATGLPEKGEDNVLAIVTFSKGAFCELVVSFTQQTVPFNSLEIHGTQGTIFENHMWDRPVRFFSFSRAMGENRKKWFEPELEHGPFPHYYTISVKHEDGHFARCILEDKEPEFSPEEARSAIECILTGYLSAIKGREITSEELVDFAKQNCSASIIKELGEHIVTRPGLPEEKRVKPLGLDIERAARVMEKHGLDLVIATSPVNVYYLTGLPVLPSAPNPILFALKNMYHNIAILRWDGHVCLLHWELFRSTEKFCWAN